MAFSIPKLFLLLISSFFITSTWALNTSSTTSLDAHLFTIRTFCSSRPFPDACFSSLKLSISINISPNIINLLLQTLQTALSEAGKLTNLFSKAGGSNIIERQRGTIQDCLELHRITVSSLQRSVSRVRAGDSRKLVDARAYLSAALTNKNTCLEGLDSASGPLKPAVMNGLASTYQHVSNSLSMLPKPKRAKQGHINRRLLGFPKWMSKKDRRILQSIDGEDDPGEELIVAADGTGNFRVYAENVEIPSDKTNIVLIGDGADLTFITGNRNVVDGWTTFRSATLAVSGDGFLAMDITIDNTAGPEKHQAVALRVNADLVAFYRPVILYPESHCLTSLQSSLPSPEKPQMRIQEFRCRNCSILATEDLYSSSNTVRSYLGRPWKAYSTAAVLESYIDDFISPEGWTKWSSDGDQGLDTLYYGEYGKLWTWFWDRQQG
ncbi:PECTINESTERASE [Salix purpurea]|uniref:PECTINESTERASE n=1 Tax=Salix purpurea TaxID=77065 RepID=A0A9Q0T310_SALPP|nr:PECTINESTERASE [Salix purpurea]